MGSFGLAIGTTCLACGVDGALAVDTTRCTRCGGNLDLRYDYQAVGQSLSQGRLTRDGDRSLFRYAPLLPIGEGSRRPPFPIGWTPLFRTERLAARVGIADLLLKDEGRNPSGSLKDRASAMVLMGAEQARASTIIGASTGNAGSSMACLAASMGRSSVILVPAKAPPAKVAQLLAFGARVVLVDGSYDQAFDLAEEVGRRRGWYSRSTGLNPLTREGKKTCALEIWEQLGFAVPDWIFVGVGDGNILSGLHKGFRDLQALGLVERLPRLGAVQSTASNAVARAVVALGGGPLSPSTIVIEAVHATTRADSIAVDQPRDGVAAVRAIRESAGIAVEVTDEEILEAIPLVAGLTGVFGEPAGVASVAGLRRAIQAGLVRPAERVVCIITGSGLKDVPAAMAVVRPPRPIAPTVAAAMAAVDEG